MSYQDLSIYFFDELYNINKKRQYRLSDYCIGYLSELLVLGMHSDFSITPEGKKYLFDLYKKSVEAKGKNLKSNCFKHLGDYSLFTSGYFTDSVKHINYYIDMGSLAYNQTAILLSPEPYTELSQNYKLCISILNELSSKGRESNDMLKLYDFWSITNSQFAKDSLFALGMTTNIIEE